MPFANTTIRGEKELRSTEWTFFEFNQGFFIQCFLTIALIMDWICACFSYQFAFLIKLIESPVDSGHRLIWRLKELVAILKVFGFDFCRMTFLMNFNKATGRTETG